MVYGLETASNVLGMIILFRILAVGVGVLTILPVCAKRLHDRGMSTRRAAFNLVFSMFFVVFILHVVGVLFLIWDCGIRKGDAEANAYGDVPDLFFLFFLSSKCQSPQRPPVIQSLPLHAHTPRKF